MKETLTNPDLSQAAMSDGEMDVASNDAEKNILWSDVSNKLKKLVSADAYDRWLYVPISKHS